MSRALASNAGSWLLSQYTDRKSTRLNSSHLGISYAVFCLKKKKKKRVTKELTSDIYLSIHTMGIVHLNGTDLHKPITRRERLVRHFRHRHFDAAPLPLHPE